MKVWYDARMLGFSGIGVQVEQVLRLLLRGADPTVVPIGNPEKLGHFFPDYAGGVVPFDAPIYGLKEQLLYPALPRGVLLHVPHYAAPVKHLKRSVVVVHDLIHLQSEEFRSPRYRMYAYTLLKAVASRAAGVVAVSEYTKACLIERFPEVTDRVHVIHNGIDHGLFRPGKAKGVEAFKARLGLPGSYLLSLGIGKRHKNLDFVVRALAPLWKSGRVRLPLVIGGTGGHLPDYVSRAVAETGAGPFIRPIPPLSSSELPYLYGGATALLMPSLLEGFGFPVAEAMACGTPVLSSSRASLPEIGGDAALYFDPINEDDFREKLLDFLKRPSVRQDMVRRGKVQAGRFTWEEHVARLRALYESLNK